MSDVQSIVDVVSAPEPQLAALLVLLAPCIYLAEIFLRDDLKRKISALILRESRDASIADWPSLFVDLFDSIFGHKIWRLRFAVGSFVASALSVTLLTIVWFIFNDAEEDYLPSPDILLENPDEIFNIPFTVSVIVAMIAILGALINLLPDYLSLIQSRYIIQLMCGKSWIVVLFLLGVDFVLTSVIIFIVVVALFGIMSGSLVEGAGLIVSGVAAMLSMDGFIGLLGIFIFSTYLTSVWVWLYALSLFFMVTMFKIRFIRSGFLRIWNEDLVRKRPFSFLGMLCIVFAFVFVTGRYIVNSLL